MFEYFHCNILEKKKQNKKQAKRGKEIDIL